MAESTSSGILRYFKFRMAMKFNIGMFRPRLTLIMI